MNSSDHTKALNYYKKNQEELVQKYNGKTLIFNNDKLLIVKDNLKEAYEFALKEYGIGNFSLQEVTPDSSSYTAYFASPSVKNKE